MLDSYVLIRKELSKASQHSRCDFEMNPSPQFIEDFGLYEKMLIETDIVTKMLQTRGNTLVSCHANIEK